MVAVCVEVDEITKECEGRESGGGNEVLVCNDYFFDEPRRGCRSSAGMWKALDSGELLLVRGVWLPVEVIRRSGTPPPRSLTLSNPLFEVLRPAAVGIVTSI